MKHGDFRYVHGSLSECNINGQSTTWDSRRACRGFLRWKVLRAARVLEILRWQMSLDLPDQEGRFNGIVTFPQLKCWIPRALESLWIALGGWTSGNPSFDVNYRDRKRATFGWWLGDSPDVMFPVHHQPLGSIKG